jgi:hypothetical protein
LFVCEYKKEIVETFGNAGKENISMVKPEGMRPHRRPIRGLRVILKLFRRNRLGVSWIHVTEDSGQRRADVKRGTVLWV